MTPTTHAISRPSGGWATASSPPPPNRVKCGLGSDLPAAGPTLTHTITQVKVPSLSAYPQALPGAGRAVLVLQRPNRQPASAGLACKPIYTTSLTIRDRC